MEEDLKEGHLQGGQVIKEHLVDIKVGQEVEEKGVEAEVPQARGSQTGRVKMLGPNGEHLEVHKSCSINNRVVMSQITECTNFCSSDNLIKEHFIVLFFSYFIQ